MGRTSQQLIGQDGEQTALRFLQGQGLQLIERNFRCKLGEIDLILQEGEVLVFVEVRQRASARFGGALASITPAKQRRVMRAAQFYLQRFRHLPACRFDVVAIEAGVLNWLRNVMTA